MKREFTSLSGEWTGQSIQDGFRIMERITLKFSGDSFTGFGTDSDGEFELVGEYDPDDGAVSIVRRYVIAPKNPDQVGHPFLYIGRWDGYQVSGRWMDSYHLGYGGPFEMWPQEEEVAIEQMMQIEEEPVAQPSRS